MTPIEKVADGEVVVMAAFIEDVTAVTDQWYTLPLASGGPAYLT
jgi:hypothetical protein